MRVSHKDPPSQQEALLSSALSSLNRLKVSMGQKLESTEDLLASLLAVSARWQDKREGVERQKMDIELALDIVTDGDSKIRGLVVTLNKGVGGGADIQEYVQCLSLSSKLLAKSREASLDPSSSPLSAAYAQLEEAIGFGVSELKRYFPVELSMQEKRVEVLREIDRGLRRAGQTEQYYGMVKVYSLKMDQQTEAPNLEGFLEILRGSEKLSKEITEIVEDSGVASKILRNIYRQVSKKIYDSQLKPFLQNLPDASLSVKKVFLGATDGAFSLGKELQRSLPEIEIFMNMLTTFYFGLLEYIHSFCPSLERNLSAKNERQFEKSARQLCDIIRLIDSYTGTLSAFVLKKNIGYSDAIDLSVKVTSQFVRLLKQKGDSLKSRSQLHAHVYPLIILYMLRADLRESKKVSLKLGPGLEKAWGNAMKAYLCFCWGHVLGYKFDISSLQDQKKIGRFQSFRKSLP